MFKKATKSQGRLRLAFMGPPGSGKTYTSLAIACAIAKRIGTRVAVIDSERGSASLYADKFDFDVLELETFAPATYVKAIKAAEAAGYGVIMPDSLSHAWMGKDGALEMVDNEQRKQRGGNSFAAWRNVTPEHNALVDAMLQSRSHIVATLRTKVEYVQKKDPNTGKTTVEKVGLAPVQRDGLEYEFTIVGDIDSDHVMTVTKSRCDVLADKVIRKPGEEFANILVDWLTSGVPEVEKPAPKPVTATAPAPKPSAPVSTGTAISAEPMGNNPPADAEYASDVQSELSEAKTTDDVVTVYKKYKAILSAEGETGLRALCAARKAEIQQAA